MSNHRFVSTILLPLITYFVGGCSEEKARVVVPEDISVELQSQPPFLFSQTRGNGEWEVKFRIHNNSARQLNLAVGDVSCSCVSAQLDDAIVSPNETIRGCIRVTGPFSAGEKHIGCTLTATGSDNRSFSVPIRTSFRILSHIECRPAVIATELARGQVEGIYRFDVVTRSAEAGISILTMTDLPPGIRVVQLSKGESHSLTEQISETNWHVELALMLARDAESNRGHITVEFGGENLAMPFSIRRHDGIRIIPDEVSVRKMETNGEYRRKVVIRASDSVPFQIMTIENQPVWLQVSPLGTAPGVLHVLELTIDGRAYLEQHRDVSDIENSMITLQTTHPESHQVELKLSLSMSAKQ